MRNSGAAGLQDGTMRFRSLRVSFLVLLLAFIPGSTHQAVPPIESPVPKWVSLHTPRSLSDPALAAERKASVGWELKTGPKRRVVDLVCLVPDLSTFLSAIAAWDDAHYFPVLIDDPEYTYKFLRAFRPARVVRYPAAMAPIPPELVWEYALAAVGHAWVGSDASVAAIPSGDRVPTRFGATPPGVVVSSPTSSMLAGAVALAAGRFEPILRWEPERSYADLLTNDEANELAQDLEARIADRLSGSNQLGDDCDFITLAGDWPYRYQTAAGICSFDDRLGRSEGSGRRTAYTGRLIGSPAASVYAAMCSLFLQPDSALLFDAYDESRRVWSRYTMQPAAGRLSSLLLVTHRGGAGEADIADWHRVFDPINLFGLALLNSSGSPTEFVVRGGRGHTADIPPSGPVIVVQNHSFSAADPCDPDTIAGRWLANGAFIYFGAMNEPYLQAFRTPTLVADLMADRLPLAAAVRQSSAEMFGYPWRLLYVGDPLYCLKPRESMAPRLGSWQLITNWPAIQPPSPLPVAARDDAKLDWAVTTSLASLARDRAAATRSSLAALILTIRRERLTENQLPRYDGLFADLLDHDDRAQELRARLEQTPVGALSPILRRRLEHSRIVDLHSALAADDLSAACKVWDALIRAGPAPDLTNQLIGRVSPVADTPDRLRSWRDQLRQTLQAVRNEPAAPYVERELKRVEAKLGL
jgi:hypothetical protein